VIGQLLHAIGVLLQKAPQQTSAGNVMLVAPRSALVDIHWVDLLFGWTGRINRSKYWTAGFVLCVPMFAVYTGTFLLQKAAPAIFPPPPSCSDEVCLGLVNEVTAMLLAILAVSYPMAVVCIKRLHDLGRSGWWTGPLMVFFFLQSFTGPMLSLPYADPGKYNLVLLANAVISVPWLLISFWPGSKRANRHGPPP